MLDMDVSNEILRNAIVQTRRFWPLQQFVPDLFHCYRFGEVAWLIDIGALENGSMVGE